MILSFKILVQAMKKKYCMSNVSWIEYLTVTFGASGNKNKDNC